MSFLEDYNVKLLHIYNYFKSIDFIMDIIPALLTMIDDIYMNNVLKDACHYGWYLEQCDDTIFIHPPNYFMCLYWKGPRCQLSHLYNAPCWIYDKNVRQTGQHENSIYSKFLLK